MFVLLNSPTDHLEDLGADGRINTEMDLQEVGWGGMDWIDLAHDRDKRAGDRECGNEPSCSIKCGEFLD